MKQIDHLEHFDHQKCPFKGHFWQKRRFKNKITVVVDMSKVVIDTAINLIFTETLVLEKMTW